MTEGGDQHPAGIRHSTEPNFTSQACMGRGGQEGGCNATDEMHDYTWSIKFSRKVLLISDKRV